MSDTYAVKTNVGLLLVQEVPLMFVFGIESKFVLLVVIFRQCSYISNAVFSHVHYMSRLSPTASKIWRAAQIFC